MTVVELYTDHPPDNIVSTLALHPERIIFIGENKEITRTKAFYQRFFETIGRHTAVETAAVNPHDLTAIVRVLSRIVETEPDCVFDLTGGNDLVLIAMGMVYERYRDKGTVRMHRFNTRTGTARDVIDNTALTADKPQLTVAQAVQLYGGVVGGSTDGGQMTDWEFTPSFKRALDTMWSVCRQDPSLWNSAVTAMQEYISGTSLGGDTLCVLPDTADTQKSYRRACTLVRALEEKGVVTTEPCRQGRRVICPDAQVRRCLAKAGNLLEVRILAIVRGLQDDNGEAVFCDSRNSVYIDWDGAFGAHDTVNEMDVMAMRGMVPLFISCKNGRVEIDELYKLSTVASRFGGRHAVKVLAATYIDTDENTRAYIVQRAQDMGIHVLADIHQKTDDEIERWFRHTAGG